jgi:predicted DsbA family dithiol-disulfide isomerase
MTSIKAGLEKDEIETVLHSDAYGEAVKKDIEMAQNVGVQGVPSSSSTINMLFLSSTH